MSHYQIGLSAWIIQDGNYGEFEIGEREFAVEFAPVHVRPVEGSSEISLRHVCGAEYDVTARVVRCVPQAAWVIDVGLLAFQQNEPPPSVMEGEYVTGRVYLGVDPFFYFESLRFDPRMPALIYRWSIEGIDRETTPWIDTVDARGTTVKNRDRARTSFAPVRETNSWKDDGGWADYVLHARPIGPPHRKFGTGAGAAE